MEKTAKITRTVFKNTWENPKGGQIFYHEVELDNGDKGQIGTKEKEPAKLNPGQAITYNIETTEKGTKIKLVNEHNGFQGKKGFIPQDQRVNNTGYSMRYVVDLIVAGKVEYENLGDSFENIFGLLDKKYMEIKGEKSDKSESKTETAASSEPVNEGQINHVKKIVETDILFSKDEQTKAISKVKGLTRSAASSFINKLIEEANKRKIKEDDLPF